MFATLALAAMPLAAATTIPTLQPVDSPFAALFKRDTAPPDPSWANFSSYYPTNWKTPNTTDLPQAWLDKLKTVTLPANNPVAKTSKSNGGTSYGDIQNGGNNPDICSFTWGCVAESDFCAAPNGTWILTFDDGPTEASPRLYEFLKSNDITHNSTHFMIGSNIQTMPQTMVDAFTQGGHIAVHTWSHPYMTTLTNEEVLGELGWTLQVISDLTGGRLPAFWRPPYGDTDNRVRAIAKQVFGMECIIWNKDTNDWAIGSESGATLESVDDVMKGFITGSKEPGIIPLEHELNNNTVEVFINSYPLMQQNGWKVQTVPDAFGMEWYQNAKGNDGDVIKTMSVGEDQPDLYTNASWANPTSEVSSTGSASSANATAPASSSSVSAHQANKESSATRAGVSAAAVLLAVALAVL